MMGSRLTTENALQGDVSVGKMRPYGPLQKLKPCEEINENILQRGRSWEEMAMYVLRDRQEARITSYDWRTGRMIGAAVGVKIDHHHSGPRSMQHATQVQWAVSCKPGCEIIPNPSSKHPSCLESGRSFTIPSHTTANVNPNVVGYFTCLTHGYIPKFPRQCLPIIAAESPLWDESTL